MRKFYILLLIIIGINISVNSQPISLGYGVYDWGFQNIFPGSTFSKTAIAVDSSGYKWIGYSSAGVHKVKGYNWQYFNFNQGNLPSDSVTSIAVNNNIIYVGTKNGIAKYSNGVWTTINTSNSQLTSNIINTLFFKNNVLWVGTNNGVSKLSGTTWITYKTSNSLLCNNNVQAIEQTTNGDVWFGTSNGLSKLSGITFTTYDSINSGLNDYNIITLCSDNNNKLYIGTINKGVFVFNNNSINSLISIYPELKNYLFDKTNIYNIKSRVYKLAKDVQGSIFLISINMSQPSTSIYFIKIKSIDYKIYKIPSNIFPILYEAENNDTIWFVNTNCDIPFTVTQNLYSLVLSKGEQRDDIKFLDINNFKANISSSGFLFNDPNILINNLATVPKDSSTSTLFSGSLWLGAKDNNGNLHLAAEKYRSYGIDYQAGPISTDTNIYKMEKDKWNNVWKVSQAEINYHKTHYWIAGYVMPQSIATWPGNGTPAYGQSKYLAPYVDANNNGKYDPQNGDFPIIRGDQALYFIYNDDKIHTETQGTPFRAEIQGMAYAYLAPMDTALNNTIFISYKIYNRSQKNYDSLYIGSFTDYDIGYAFDDYSGCDTNLSMYYGYNGKNHDGMGEYFAYKGTPPAQGITLLNNTMTNFMSYNNNYGLNGDPTIPIEYYNTMKSIWKDNTHLVYGKNGHTDTTLANIPVNFTYPGNPEDTTSWSEVSAKNTPYDRRGVGSSGPYSFAIDSCHCFDVAYTFAQDFSDTLNTTSVHQLKQYVQHIKNFYNINLNHNCSDLFSSVNEIIQINPEVFIYPNPVNSYINIVSKGMSYKKNLKIMDIQGRLILEKNYTEDKITLDIHNLTKGIYILFITDSERMITKKIIKQ